MPRPEDIARLVDGQRRKLLTAIESLDPGPLLGQDTRKQELMRRFCVDVPTIEPEGKRLQPPREITYDLGQDDDCAIARGTMFVLEIPFRGDANLCGFLRWPEEAVVELGTLYLKVKTRAPTVESVLSQFESWIDTLLEDTEALRIAFRAWNEEELPRRIDEGIARRLQKLRTDRDVAAALGYPLKHTLNAEAYAVPLERRDLAVCAPILEDPGSGPEPFLDIRAYEEVLGVLSNMAIAIERSPSVFLQADEEDLRDFMLVMLNAVFSGQATGETFNRKGKTDILVRVDNRDIFIGECKMWDGPNTLVRSLDQLLDYSCWRDAKVAVLLFSRNRCFRRVVDAIQPTVKAHRCHRRDLDYTHEAAHRFAIQHPEHCRDMILTVMAFDLSPPQSPQP